MQLKNHNFCFIVLMTACFLIACNDADDTTEINASDTTTAVTSYANSDKSSMPAYDAAMDPLTVEAAFTRKLGDTLNIKMYEVTLSREIQSHCIHILIIRSMLFREVKLL